MFQKYENEQFVSDNLFKEVYKYDYDIDNREFWNKISKGLPKCFFENTQWELKPLYASLYMEVSKSGDRLSYETEYFKRRQALTYYTFAEAIENNGQYTEKIIDIVWMILEETSWALPSHACLSSKSDCLPDANDNILDLFAAETGALLAFTYGVMKKRFELISKNILPYIKNELKRRVIDSYMNHEHYWWMGFEQKPVNNWNPWINSNVLHIIPLFCDEEDMTALIIKIMSSLDCFADNYPDDGACEEGPMYWFKSGVCLVECIELLYDFSNGSINELNQSKVKNTLNFYKNILIHDDLVINFADASPHYVCEYGVLYHLAKLVKDEQLINFCTIMRNKFKDSVIISLQEPFRIINASEANSELEKKEGNKVLYADESYYQNIQLYIKRFGDDCFFAAKGGHNDESHNHNDVGSFIFYKHGTPFIIDAGYKKYTADTFSDRRYAIWTNCSEYHNLPTIGKKNQMNGREYKSENVLYRNNHFSLDIEKAYENDESIILWNRSFDIDENALMVTEKYEFTRLQNVTLNFLVACKPDIKNNTVLLCNNANKLVMKFGEDIHNIICEEIKLSDIKLLQSWGNSIYRLQINIEVSDLKGTITYKLY